MTKSKKLLLSALVVGVLGSFVALGAFGLFSATTQNSGNEISSGVVSLSDNDAGSSLVNVTGAKPGDSWTRCIKVTYSGSLPSQVHMYREGVLGPLAAYIHLTVTTGQQGTSTFPSCSGFTPDAGGGVAYDGPLAAPGFTDWATGLPVSSTGETTWHPGDTVGFQITATLDPAVPDSLQNSTMGNLAIFWEARNV